MDQFLSPLLRLQRTRSRAPTLHLPRPAACLAVDLRWIEPHAALFGGRYESHLPPINAVPTFLTIPVLIELRFVIPTDDNCVAHVLEHRTPKHLSMTRTTRVGPVGHSCTDLLTMQPISTRSWRRWIGAPHDLSPTCHLVSRRVSRLVGYVASVVGGPCESTRKPLSRR